MPGHQTVQLAAKMARAEGVARRHSRHARDDWRRDAEQRSEEARYRALLDHRFAGRLALVEHAGNRRTDRGVVGHHAAVADPVHAFETVVAECHGVAVAAEVLAELGRQRQRAPLV